MLTVPVYPIILTAMRTPESPPTPKAAVFAGLQAAGPPLILASGSQTRLSLLRDAGLTVDVRTPRVDEAAIKRAARDQGHGPDQTAQLLADRKAGWTGDPDAIVIGADQLLVCERNWFDKPRDLAEARTQLLALRGRPHVLHTAFALSRDGRIIGRHVSRPRLVMRAFSEATLDAYLALEGGRVLSSVGAYRLEGPGIQLFEAVEGEHAAILGLPMLALLDMLRREGALAR